MEKKTLDNYVDEIIYNMNKSRQKKENKYVTVKDLMDAFLEYDFIKSSYYEYQEVIDNAIKSAFEYDKFSYGKPSETRKIVNEIFINICRIVLQQKR